MKGSCAVIAMYTHEEGYPLSLNGIQRLSSLFDLVVVVHRNTAEHLAQVFKDNFISNR